MKQIQERFMFCLLIIGALIIGLILGYMLAMQGVYELLNHIRIENIIIDLNETQIVDYIITITN